MSKKSFKKNMFQAGYIIFICIFWVGLGYFYYTDRANSKLYWQGYDSAKKECENMRINSKDYSPEGYYDLYHDNGPNKAPICRQPNNTKEVQAVIDARIYQQKLENGEVDPDSSDENCYSWRICN